MTKHEIVHIIKVIFRQIKKTIPSIVKHFDQDSIHKFRVQIKKLRAFLRLLSYEMEEPKDLKLPKSLKKNIHCYRSSKELTIASYHKQIILLKQIMASHNTTSNCQMISIADRKN
jgi:CHAD domain-containing protein